MKKVVIQLIVVTAIFIFANYSYADINTDTAAEQLLRGIGTHSSHITVHLISEDKESTKIAKELYETALTLSDDEDYYKYGLCAGYSVNYNYYEKDGRYYYTFHYIFNYRINEAQEKVFNKELQKTIDSLHLKNKSDKAKVRIIYRYITTHVRYDKSKSKTKFTAYGALHKHKAACQGCAVLFCEMCQAAHLDAHVITGKSFGQNHAWDIVEIGHKYYNVDVTWDLGRKSHYKYFLKRDKKFKNHKRNK